MSFTVKTTLVLRNEARVLLILVGSPRVHECILWYIAYDVRAATFSNLPHLRNLSLSGEPEYFIMTAALF